MADEPVVAAPPVVAPPAGDPPPAPPPAASGEPPVAPPAGDPAKPPATELGKPPEKPASAVAFDAAKLTLPEGMKTDDPLFKTFAETFGDDKLDPQARGQKLIDLYKDAITGMKYAQTKAWTDTNDGWIKEVKADPEIGGAKFAEVKTTIAKAIDSLGPELSVAFRQGLDATGAGNHPAIWKGLAKMAAAMTEGGHVQGNPSSAKPDLGATFFPNSKMN
jgi:hypothetical protein